MSKVDDWIACDLRYVAETKLNRLTDDELARLYFGLGKKHNLSITTVSADRDTMIEKLMVLKKEIQVAYARAAATEKALSAAEATKAVEEIFAPEAPVAEEGEGDADGNVPELTEDEKAARKDREERTAAFIQLAAAVSAGPEPPPAEEATGEAEHEADFDIDRHDFRSPPVTVDTHHRLRICSFNACKMRLGSANKAYTETTDHDDPAEYEGTHKGAELAKKWLTLAAKMADFDVIVLQEVPGTEKVMNEKVETFAAMLEIATEEGQYWTAVSSQKSGKDGKVVGPGAEVHVCFVKSPVAFKGWSTLRKVGATELDYAPLQVVLHDPRFADPADQDFVVTSVHLPPSKRVDARDSQIAALLRNYSAPDTSEYRMQQPFKPSREAKVSPTHVIAGDFNTHPGHEQYNMLGSGFVSKIPKNAATTSGHQSFDNVLIDTHANDRLLIGGGILQLKDPHNAAKGQVGLSDHYPVFVEVCEVQKTGKQPEPLPVVESELVEDEPPPLESVREEEEEEEEKGGVVETGEDEEATVRAVVRTVMEQVTRSVIATNAPGASEGEAATAPEAAPPEAAPSTEEPPPSPPPPPVPAPDTPPTTSETELTQEEANRALDRELAEVLGEELLASGTDEEAEKAQAEEGVLV